MGWRDLLSIRINGWALDIHVGGVLIGLLLTLILGLALLRRRGGGGWRVTKANFKFAGLGHVEICPDDDVARIAHTAWVELSSRKAAIPFDPDYDVITEVYNSWYELFRSLRELAKTIPAEAISKNRDASTVAEIILKALNDGLRPHLTRWQARFRRWYDTSLTDPQFKSLSPQELQRQFPDYRELVEDLQRVNAGMIQFTEELRRVAHERRPQRSWSLSWKRSPER